MKRCSLNIAMALFLLFLVATACTWRNSYRSPSSTVLTFDGPRGPRGGILDGAEFRLGISSQRGVLLIEPADSFYFWRVPYWKIALLWLALIALCAMPPWLRTLLGPKNLEGYCPCCGYDLRASKERYPECGTPIPEKTEAVA